jgi:hypothetical protein
LVRKANRSKGEFFQKAQPFSVEGPKKVEVAGVEPRLHRKAKSLNNADLVDC